MQLIDSYFEGNMYANTNKIWNGTSSLDNFQGPPRKKLCRSRWKEHVTWDQKEMRRPDPIIDNICSETTNSVSTNKEYFDLRPSKKLSKYNLKLLSSSPEDFEEGTFQLVSDQEHTGIYHCLDCVCCFSAEEELSYHLKCHNFKNQRFECMECSMVMEHWYLLRNHLWVEHAIHILEVDCKKCIFQTAYYLNKASYQLISSKDCETSTSSIVKKFLMLKE